jgi:hypothetical protein
LKLGPGPMRRDIQDRGCELPRITKAKFAECFLAELPLILLLSTPVYKVYGNDRREEA